MRDWIDKILILIAYIFILLCLVTMERYINIIEQNTNDIKALAETTYNLAEVVNKQAKLLSIQTSVDSMIIERLK